MNKRISGCVVLMAAVMLGAVRRPQVAVPTTQPGLIAPPTGQTIGRATLDQMDRDELGAAYDPVQADQLYGAHQLLEKYFQAHTAADRKSIVGQLQATQIDPNVLGRLCRIRMHWPELAGGGVFYINERIGPHDVRYFLGVPKAYDRTKAWPLVIKLPGAQAFVTTPPPDAQRVVQIYTAWIQGELSHHPDAVVLMPLLNLDELYGPSFLGMNSVIEPLLDALEHVNIDPRQVYMAGHSMAAQAVWNLAIHYPTYFAAINPLAGTASEDWQRLRLVNLINVLPVVWHDENDPVLKFNFSKSLVNQLRDDHIDVDFLATKGVGHTPTEPIVAAEYKTMRAQLRTLYPPKVWLATNRPDVLLNREDWVQIYQELDTGPERHLFFRHGTGHMTTYPHGCEIKARCSNNEIDASADNVQTLRFYLNDQMINMAEPLTVNINGKQKFKGLVHQSIDQMLKDQLYLGRGWRYFSGVVDVTMVPPTTQPTTKPATAPVHKGRIIVGPRGQ